MIKDADELKMRCIKIARRYLGGLITTKPTDIRTGAVNCIGLITVFHGPFCLADWIDNVWQGPGCN